MHRCGVNEPVQYEQCLGCAGGGALVGVVVAGQAVDIQSAANRVSNVSLRYRGRRSRIAYGKDLFSACWCFCLMANPTVGSFLLRL